MTPQYIRHRGETIIVAVADSAAVPGGEVLVTCHMRALQPAGRLDPTQGATVSLTVSYRPADSNFPVGWWLWLDAEASVDLAIGKYQIDLNIVDAVGRTLISRRAFIEVREPATPISDATVPPLTWPAPGDPPSDTSIDHRVVQWILDDEPSATWPVAAIYGIGADPAVIAALTARVAVLEDALFFRPSLDFRDPRNSQYFLLFFSGLFGGTNS